MPFDEMSFRRCEPPPGKTCRSSTTCGGGDRLSFDDEEMEGANMPDDSVLSEQSSSSRCEGGVAEVRQLQIKIVRYSLSINEPWRSVLDADFGCGFRRKPLFIGRREVRSWHLMHAYALQSMQALAPLISSDHRYTLSNKHRVMAIRRSS